MVLDTHPMVVIVTTPHHSVSAYVSNVSNSATRRIVVSSALTMRMLCPIDDGRHVEECEAGEEIRRAQLLAVHREHPLDRRQRRRVPVDVQNAKCCVIHDSSVN